jgi:two-component system phosphate regulon response regulator OmpR
MEPSAKILIVDDDEDLRLLLQRYLGGNGFLVRSLADATGLDRALGREAVDILVLDLMLPGEDGLSVCRRLRARGERALILMLTAKGDPLDRILGLEMGADDYLAKPFEPRELLARLHALLRRRAMNGVLPALPSDAPCHFGDYELNPVSRSLSRRGERIALSSGEFALLQALASFPNVPLGRERLLELLRGRGHALTERAIDVQVLRLRRLIEDDPASPAFIRTVRGVGYVFVPGEAP